MLVLEPPPVPTEEGAGDTRGFFAAGLPSSPAVPFLAALAGRFLTFAKIIQKYKIPDEDRPSYNSNGIDN